MISNPKTWIAGTDHGTSAGHLQVYLDEFTFRSLDLGTHRPPLPTGTSQPEETAASPILQAGQPSP
jgi:hypothetical protein